MADDSVQVKITGDASDAQSSLSSAASSINASLQQIKDALQNWGSKNKEITDQALRNNADLSRSFIELKASVSGGFDGVIGVVERFRGVLGSLTAILAGGVLWKESVSEMLRMEDAVRGLTITFGLNTDKATTMAVALKLAGISADTFEGMAFKVGRTIKSNSEEFDRLGVAIKDANGDFLPMDQILQNIFRRMQDFKAGTDQNEFALATVGRSAKDFASDMLRLNAVTERAAQLQRDLGIEMGPERMAAIEAYRIETAAFGIVIGNLGDRIGELVLPRLMSLAQYFNDVGPGAVNVFVKALTYVLTGLDVVATHAKEIYIVVASAWDNLVIKTQATVQAFKALVTEGWNAAATIAADANRRILRNQMETNAQVLGMEADMIKRLSALQAEREAPKVPGPGPMPSGTETFHVPPKAGADDTMARWRQELEQLQDAQGLFNEMSKRDEAAFWEAKLQMLDSKGKDYVKQYAEIYHLMHEAQRADAKQQLTEALATLQLEIDAAKNNKDQQLSIAHERSELIKATYGEESAQYKIELDKELKLRQEWVTKEQAIMKTRTAIAEQQATFEIQVQRNAMTQALALRQISTKQQFEIERQLENDLFALKLAELQKEQALLDSSTDAYWQVQKKIEALEQQHQLALTQIDQKAELDRQKSALEAAQAVETSFGAALASIEDGTKSVSKAFKDMAASIIKSINDIAAKNIAQAIFGGGSAGGAGVMSLFGSLFGTASAASGGASAWTTGGFATAMASFAMGTPYVPQDMIAMVHRGEAIIPAAQNVKGFGAGVNITNQFAINGPTDARSQQQIAAAAAAGTQRAMQRNM